MEKLEELLKCSICLDTYTDPKLLQCSHAYCKDCLEHLAGKKKKSLTCPTCRKEMALLDKGVADLPPAFRINSLLEIRNSLVSSPVATKQPVRCPEHDKELEFFCFACEEMVCWKCAQKGSQHVNHLCKKLDQAFELCQENLDFLKSLEHIVEDMGIPNISRTDVAKLNQAMKSSLHNRNIFEQVKVVRRLLKMLQKTSGVSDYAVFGRGIQEAALGMTSSFVVRVLAGSMLWKEPPTESVVCVLVCKPTGARITASVVKIGFGTFEVNYEPKSKGKHQLHLTVAGSHIAGSPFSVDIESRDEDSPFVYSDLNGPYGIAVHHKRIFFSEEKGNRIGECKPGSDGVDMYGSFGSMLGRFNSPRGVAVDGDGNILIADSGNHRIQWITPDFQFCKAVGGKGNNDLQFNFPSGVAVNPLNAKIYIVDKNHRVQVLNSNLSFSLKFGRYGNGPGQFNDPRGIACDCTGKVYVADTRNKRVQVFTPDGGLLRVMRVPTRGCGPVGVAVDSRGDKVFLCAKDCISVLTSEGSFVQGLVPRGERSNPTGVAVDDDFMYICGDDCVELIPLKGIIPNMRVRACLKAIFNAFAIVRFLLKMLFRCGPCILIPFISIVIVFIAIVMF